MEFVSDKPVTERRTVGMDVQGGVDHVRFYQSRSVTGLSFAVIAFPAESQHPAGHCQGNILGAKIPDQRSRPDKRQARRRFLFSCSNNRFRFFNSVIWADSDAAGMAPDSVAGDGTQCLSVVIESPKSGSALFVVNVLPVRDAHAAVLAALRNRIRVL